jgi:hypothetical protein
MKRLLKYTALIATVLVMCSSAWALSYSDHINTAPNNKGDVLVFPWFLALDGGWQTKLTVINTDTTNSVVAKVVFRSFKNSEELLDFFIYLSPADVWTGKIYYNIASKKIKVFSDDDSIATSTAPTFATPAEPVDQLMFPVECSDDGDFMGYVDVIMAGYGFLGNRPLAKSVIYAAYDTLKLPAATGYDFQYGSINVLAGFMEFGNGALGLTAGYPATALKDYKNQNKLTVATETKLGQGSNNSYGELEASISKDYLAMPYVNSNDVALHFFTFPTKQTNFATCTAVTTTVSPYFHQNADSKTCIPYTVKVFDLKENSPGSGTPFSGGAVTTNKFCYEVNFVSSAGFPYAEGWGHYIFGDTTVTTTSSAAPLRFAGTPVLATYLYLGNSGLSGNYGAWTDTAVYGATTATNQLVDYQYTDLIVVAP